MQRLDDGLSLESLDGERGRLGRQDDEGDDGHVRTSSLQAVVQTRQGLDEHVNALVTVLVTSCGEKVQSLVGIEVIVAIEVTADKVIDPLLVGLMQVLELVRGRKLLDVETIGQDAIGLPLEQVLTLVGGDVGDSGEDIGSMSGATFYAVPVVNASLASLRIAVEPLEVVVEIHRTRTQVATEKSGMCGEDCRDVDPSLLAKGEGDTCKPLVELCHDGALLFVVDILQQQSAVHSRLLRILNAADGS